MNLSAFDLSKYENVARHGFLPPKQPLEALPGPYFDPWEQIAAHLASLISKRMIRCAVRSMPVLSSQELNSESEWRRAYVVLGFLLQGYIWGGSKPEEVIPSSLSLPLLEVAAHFDLPPAATYSGLCLWNYRVLDPTKSIENPDNLATLLSFTASEDEEWFYLTSVAIEARGARMIAQLLNLLSASQSDCTTEAISYLKVFTEDLHCVTTVLSRVRERCQPHVFYHDLRPFLNGTKDMAQEGLPRGVLLDNGTGFQQYHQYSGGSNAQSSLIQLFDVVLGIQHEPSAARFMEEMRQYMPGDHRRFVEQMTTVGSIRGFVKRHQQDYDLNQAYDFALEALRELRDVHLHIVTQYVVAQSSTPLATTSPSVMNRRAPSKTDCSKDQSAEKTEETSLGSLRGTGGTPLIQFLKSVRDSILGLERH